ncbi:hypothetical protein KFE80_00055 [bacterium SCSIO 12696]|nr:hypothetical protein KFE80_00055 [bacterium SCSIO 12696]
MKEVEFKVSGIDEVRALHRVIMAAKFSEPPRDDVICGSPFVAELANRVVDFLMEYDESVNPSFSESWKAWRTADPSRREWKVALSAIDLGAWRSFNEDSRKKFAELLMSPLKLSDVYLEEFLKSVDQSMDSG